MHQPVKRVTKRSLAKAETSRKVLEGARLMFEERGYEGTTMRDLADSIDMSTGAIFASFPSKSHLLLALLTQDYERLRNVMWSMPGDTVRDRIINVLAGTYVHYQTIPDFLSVKLAAFWREEPNLRAFFRMEGEGFQSGMSELLIVGTAVTRDTLEEETGECIARAGALWAFHVDNLVLFARRQVTLDEVLKRVGWQVNLLLKP